MTFIPPDWNADVASKDGAELSHLHAKCNVMRESLSDWEDCMASCFAYLRSALSGIEQLSIHPSPSLGDAGYLFELASRSVAIRTCSPRRMQSRRNLRKAICGCL